MERKKAIRLISAPFFVVVGAVAFIFGGPRMLTSCGNSGDYALERLRACPEAVKHLGDDIRYTYGIACGSVETEGSNEEADVSVPVRGSKARGKYSYSVRRVGNDVRFAGTLEVGGEEIDIAACSPQGGKVKGKGTLTGKVLASTHPKVKAGTRCKGELVFYSGDRPATLKVSCSGVVVYNGKGNATNREGLVTFTDGEKTAADGTPAVTMAVQTGKKDGEGGPLTIHDDRVDERPAFKISIAI